MSSPYHKTTIDQHQGDHAATGLPIMSLKDIVTRFEDLSQESWDGLDAEAQAWWSEVVADYHAATVDLESLDSEHRSRAKDEVIELAGSADIEDCPRLIRQAIIETTVEV